MKAYLALNDHARVVRREIVGNAEIDPIPPDEDDDDYAKWVQSEQGCPWPPHRDCHQCSL